MQQQSLNNFDKVISIIRNIQFVDLQIGFLHIQVHKFSDLNRKQVHIQDNHSKIFLLKRDLFLTGILKRSFLDMSKEDTYKLNNKYHLCRFYKGFDKANSVKLVFRYCTSHHNNHLHIFFLISNSLISIQCIHFTK